MLSGRAQPPAYVERLVGEIGLSDDQAPHVDSVLKQAVLDRQAIRIRYAQADVEEMRSKLKSVTSRADRELAGILSKTQFSKFIAYRIRLRRRHVRLFPPRPLRSPSR
jgi:hypothetical protein